MHFSHQIHTITLGERDIDDHHIRFQLADRGARFPVALRLAANRQVRFRIDHLPQAVTHDRMIVDDQHAGFFV